MLFKDLLVDNVKKCQYDINTYSKQVKLTKLGKETCPSLNSLGVEQSKLNIPNDSH